MLRLSKTDGNLLPLLFLESLLIVGSILLAFGLSGWWEARQDRQLAEHALVSFEEEIRQNRANLLNVMPYHRHLKEQFETVASRGEIASFMDLMQGIEGFEGLRPAFLTSTAWNTAIATGALGYLDFEIVRQLSNVYTMQERFIGMSDSRFVMAPGAFSDRNIPSTLTSLTIYMSDVTYSGAELEAVYGQVIEFLENR